MTVRATAGVEVSPPLATSGATVIEKPRPRGSTDGVLNMEVLSQHPEKLVRSRVVPRKSIATRAGSKSEPSRILLNIRLLSGVRFSGHKTRRLSSRAVVHNPAAFINPS
jgi:hypothetical protein